MSNLKQKPLKDKLTNAQKGDIIDSKMEFAKIAGKCLNKYLPFI